MKTLGRLVLYSLPTLTLVLIPATLSAAPHGPGHGPWFGSGAGHGPFGGGFMAERIAERLDLSEDQREQIRAIHDSYREEAESLMEAMGVAQLVLRGRIHADVFDEAAIREAAAEVAAAEADLAVLRAKIGNDVRQVLTPEQVAEAELLHDRMRGFADGWRGHRRWGQRGFDSPPTDGQ